MRFSFLLLLFLVSCAAPDEKDRLKQQLAGNWLVVAEDHDVDNSDQMAIYARIQDSMVVNKCLKLIVFNSDGSFQQIDYPDVSGKWAVSPAKELFIARGGQGFEDLKASLATFSSKQMVLQERIRSGGQLIRVGWHFKKMEGTDLFSAKRNAWRTKPAQPESETMLRQRLVAMLEYYADYIEMIGKEASYFIPARFIVPVRFYQHAMGTLPFDSSSRFAQLFYNNEQARQAYAYLKQKVYALGNEFPSGEDYADEYMKFMRIVAEKIK